MVLRTAAPALRRSLHHLASSAVQGRVASGISRRRRPSSAALSARSESVCGGLDCAKTPPVITNDRKRILQQIVNVCSMEESFPKTINDNEGAYLSAGLSHFKKLALISSCEIVSPSDCSSPRSNFARKRDVPLHLRPSHPRADLRLR